MADGAAALSSGSACGRELGSAHPDARQVHTVNQRCTGIRR